MNKEYIAENEKKIKRQQMIMAVITYVFLIFLAVGILIPFYWMILTSLKSGDQIDVIPPILWLMPWEWEFGNFAAALQVAPYGRYMLNTVIISCISTTGTLVTTVLASFAFARLNFKGKDLMFSILLSTMMIPGEMFVITNFITVSNLGWYSFDQSFGEALIALSIPFMTSVFYIFFLRQNFKQIPDELYLAAKVDGTSDFKYLYRIMVPIAKPTLITITILNMMGAWSAYIWPNLVTNDPNYRLVTNGLRNAYTTNGGQVAYNEQMAAALIVTVPLLIVFLLLKKQILRGVARSGLKG